MVDLNITQPKTAAILLLPWQNIPFLD